jgi:hypothetical protein
MPEDPRWNARVVRVTTSLTKYMQPLKLCAVIERIK